MSAALRGLLDMGASTMRGGVASLLGIPGDIGELINASRTGEEKGKQSEYGRFPTTKQWKEVLPTTGTKGFEAYEDVGEYANPVTPAKKALAVTGGAEALKAGLYANALRKDLLHSHGTHVGEFLPKGSELPREFYNLSLGVTKNKLSDFGGNVVVVPQLGKFDPKTSPSSLSAFDSYSPRWPASHVGRIDEKMPTATQAKEQKLQQLKIDLDNAISEGDADKHWDLSQEYHKINAGEGPKPEKLSKEEVQKIARMRNVDRHVSQFPKGGQMQEGAGPPPLLADLPMHGQGGYLKQMGMKPGDIELELPPAPETTQMLSYGHRFPSFKDYEKSPGGYGRLDDKRLQSPDEVYEEIEGFLESNKRDIAKSVKQYYQGNSPVKLSTEVPEILKALAQQNPKSPKFDPVLQNHARELIYQLRNTNSPYAELKVYGATQLNPENFAGILANSNMHMRDLVRLEHAAKNRGLKFDAKPFEPSPLKKLEAFNVAKEMQGFKP